MNPYEVLEVPADSTEQEVVKAYRRKSLQHHPDRGGDADECKTINEAYGILSNPKRRKRFDETGDATDRRKHNAAEAAIAELLADAFAQDRIDPVRWIKDRLAARRADHQEQRDKLISGREKLAEKIARFKAANERTTNPNGRDFVLEALETGLLAIDTEIANQNSAAELLTESLALLNGLAMPVVSNCSPYANGVHSLASWNS